MGHITFIEHDGTQHEVDIEVGKSLMQIAIDHAVPGIVADCGGECACGTCHVILADRWFNIAGNATVNELQMLDLTPEKTSTSRLACQIQVSDAMNGMQVYLPEFQM